MSSDSEGEGPLFPPGEAAPAHCQQGDATYTIRFPSQSSYQCPCCKTWYNLLSSLRRHVRVSHPELALRDLFVCDVCGSEADSLKQITSHVKSTHGAIAPPASANGAFQCTYCALRFHSKVSLSQHVRGRHMEEACKVRAEASASENATEKRKAWTHDEVERFKAALIRFGPLSNVAIADAVGTRTNKQVGVFKRAFLTKNPDWISANAPPQTTPPLSRSTALPGLNLADAICCDAGYTLAGGKVNSLAYADDICLVAADKVETQGLLNRCMEFVEWAGLKFNAAKCGTPCLVSHICRPFIPTSTGVRDHSITSCIYLVIGIALCNVMICN